MVQSTPKADWLRQQREKAFVSVTAPATEAKTCKACIEYRKRIAALEAQLKALTERVNTPLVNAPVNAPVNAAEAAGARKDMAAYMRDSRAAKKAGLTIQEYRAKDKKP